MGKIERSLRTITLRREQYLSEQGSKPEFVYFPESAVISHQRILADGRTVEIALTGRQGSVGVTSIFGSGILAASVQVAQAGVAVRIEREMLKRITRIHPELIPLLVIDIANYVNDVSLHSICNTYHDLRQRLANWLLSVNELSGASTIAVTHEQLAKTLGVYRPSITCTAVELRSEGLIEYSRGSVTIKDRARLEAAACQCYAERVTSH